MNTTVLNLDSLAVTEYTTPFTGLSGAYEATADGVFQAGGTTDDGTAITWTAQFGLTLGEKARLQSPRYTYVHCDNSDGMSATVVSTSGSYEYGKPQRHRRASRFTLGRGVRDSYLQMGVKATSLTAITVDTIEFETGASANRRM